MQIGVMTQTHDAQSLEASSYSKVDQLYGRARGKVQWRYQQLRPNIWPYPASQEALWLRTISKELQLSTIISTMLLHSDSKGAVDLTKHNGYRPRSKHIDIRHNFVRERVRNENITIMTVPSTEMTADVLTKGLFAPKFKDCVVRLGLRNKM